MINILFIGLGSIAARHIKNLKSIRNDIRISVFRSGKGQCAKDGILNLVERVCTMIEELDDYYDAIFITNPTSLHYETISKFYNRSNAFFVEKPVFLTGEEDISRFDQKRKNIYVACPLRHSNVIQWLKANIDFGTVHSIRVISSSYLPDWRPGADYRNTYSAHLAMGGGVSVDLIHEWDYIYYLVGLPLCVQCLIKKKSDLEIESDDIAVYIAEYSDKLVEVHLDYFGRKTIRRIELFAQEDTIIADLIRQRIRWMCAGKELDLFEERDSYQKKELRHFFDIVSGKAVNDNTIEDACRVLRIARSGNGHIIYDLRASWL